MTEISNLGSNRSFFNGGVMNFYFEKYVESHSIVLINPALESVEVRVLQPSCGHLLIYRVQLLDRSPTRHNGKSGQTLFIWNAYFSDPENFAGEIDCIIRKHHPTLMVIINPRVDFGAVRHVFTNAGYHHKYKIRGEEGLAAIWLVYPQPDIQVTLADYDGVDAEIMIA